MSQSGTLWWPGRRLSTTDEQRIRSNMAVVGAGDALRVRLLRQLDADETSLAELVATIATANTAGHGGPQRSHRCGVAAQAVTRQTPWRGPR